MSVPVFVHRSLIATALVGLLAAQGAAQTSQARDELLRLVPRDAGFCLIINNLRDHAEKLDNAPWLKTLRASPLARVWAASPEAAQFAKTEVYLKQQLQIDWPQLRDDILGDTLVLAYRPGPSDKPQDEEGVLLLRVRKPEALERLIERLNESQTKSKQLKELQPLVWKDQKYFRRVEDKTHFYFVNGPLLAFSGKEAVIRRIIDEQRQPTPQPLVAQLRRARADQALAAVWLNPRAFDADLHRKATQALAGQAQVLESFLSYWRAVDAIILTASAGDSLELKMSLQARARDLPKSARPLFQDNGGRSDLWTRFPADSIVRVAGRLDAQALAETVAELTPASDRSKIDSTAVRYLQAALGLDLNRDLLPNLGPDWGLCIAPAKGSSDMPLALAALAVKPGKKNVDQALYKGAQLLAALATLGYNSSHGDSIRVQTTMLDNVEVKYLSNDKIFPSGFQPAFALKDGYFLLASAPEAIRTFKKNEPPEFPAGENPIAVLSLSQLEKYLQAHRQIVIAAVAGKNQASSSDAEQLFDGLMTGLRLFDHIMLSERREADQVTWSVRLAESGRQTSERR